MYCLKCGSAIKENEKFCSSCGTPVEQPVQSEQPVQQVNNEVKKETLGTISMIFGIVTLVLSFVFTIFMLPFSLAGLIMGIINKVKKGKKISGIILNTIAILVQIGLVVLVIIGVNVLNNEGFFEKLLNELQTYPEGRYDCKTSLYSDDYAVSLYLEDDHTFVYGPYGDLDKNYAKGTYTYEKKDKESPNLDKNVNYFTVIMNGKKEDFISNGKPSDHDFNVEMEMGVYTGDNGKEAAILFTNSYNVYYCYER